MGGRLDEDDRDRRRDDNDRERRRRRSDDVDAEPPPRKKREEKRDREAPLAEDEGRRRPRKRQDEDPPPSKKRRRDDDDQPEPQRPQKKASGEAKDADRDGDRSAAKRRSDGASEVEKASSKGERRSGEDSRRTAAGAADVAKADPDKRRSARGAADDEKAYSSKTSSKPTSKAASSSRAAAAEEADGFAEKASPKPAAASKKAAKAPASNPEAPAEQAPADRASADGAPARKAPADRAPASRATKPAAGNGAAAGDGADAASEHGSVPAGAGSSSGSEDSVDSRTRRKISLKGAMGFGAGFGGGAPHAGAGGGSVALLPDKVQGLLAGFSNIAQDMAKMRQFIETSKGPEKPAKTPREEGTEAVLKMPSKLTESLLHADNVPRLLELTGLASCSKSKEGHVVLRGHTKKGVSKALGQLRRVAFHCQWGCTKEKVSQLLEAKPPRPMNAMLVRMAATSSRLVSHEAKLTQQAPKLRMGTQGGGGPATCQVEGIPGLSRRHCTVTFEPEKAGCYIQDLSTNGTYLNGKRLPRPPFKNPTDARVRLFHGDEVFFRLRSEDAEELGFVVNLMPLS